MNHEQKIEEIKKNIEILHPPEQGNIVEVRTIKNKGHYKEICSGYFSDYKKLAEEALKYDGQVDGVYITMNQIDPSLIARSSNEIKKTSNTTKDHDVTRRQWILVDCDAERPDGISSTDNEKKSSQKTARQVYKFLKDKGVPDPILADSGNGHHLLYKVDLPNTDDNTTLVSRFLEAINAYCSNGKVKIDKKVGNASRITKLYGTLACKGEDFTIEEAKKANTEPRPHRYSKFVYVPKTIKPVSRELIERITKLLPQPEHDHHFGNDRNERFDLQRFISKHGIEIKRTKSWQDGTMHEIRICPFNPEHDKGEARIIEFSDGRLSFGCFHDSCSQYKWSQFRDKYEPGWRDKKQRNKTAPENTPQEKNQDEKDYILNNDFKPKLHPAMSFIDGELAYGIPNGKKPQFVTNHKLIKYSVIKDEYVIDNYPQQLKFSRSGIKKYLKKEKIKPTELYNDIRRLFENHIIFQFDWQIDLTVTWVIGTYLYRAFPLYPYYWIKSPTKRCGKTRLLELMAGLCFNSNGLETAPSEATLYRVPDITAGALLWDEVENLGKNKDKNDLISILNTSYREDGKIARCEGKDYKVKFYSAYRPVALAGIRNLPDTVEDRSLKVELLRKKRDEKVKKLQINRIKNELEKLRDDLHIFALEHANLIREAYDDFDDSLIPDRVDDRLRDAFEVMMSVAAGVEYRDPDFNLIPVLKTAAKSLSGIRKSDEDEISFIRAVNILKSKLDSSGDDCLILTSKEAVEMFNKGGIEWVSESKHASSILRNLGFRSGSHRPGDDVIRAYKITKEKIDDLDLRYGNVPYSEEKSEQSVTT